ncbi:L-idonate 5-dehydrogenase [Devosia enhydra]|uniref:L-idonate 5-dehydrogenase n=1 Tax=Devosia enhydra TaxID=665118 RepID=A0A1K2HS28_9HYPH|nr:L-idonate 5-dehydrogenase [Devosia enhydra]SFZ80625.1 L-idonate 5-dehydrogenase [Devosia enhydra]
MTKALVIHAQHDLRIDPISCGEPGPGEVLVAMARGGICGSDLHYYHHGGIGTAIRLKGPMVLGHEVSGRVAALGSGVDHLAVGDLVAVNPSSPCGRCTYCRSGLPNHCLEMTFLGSAMRFPHADGGFRSQMVVRAENCVPAAGLSPEAAAMAEPLAVCLHALHQAGDIVGKRVLVTGCGPIGLLCVMLARRLGAAEVTATDIGETALERARALGADTALNVGLDPDWQARHAARKGHFDVQFECSGAPQALATGVAVLRPRGIIVQVGLGGDIVVPLQQITAKELQLRGSFRFTSAFAEAVALLRRGVLSVDGMVTQHFALDDAREAFETASNRNIANKVQLVFDA